MFVNSDQVNKCCVCSRILLSSKKGQRIKQSQQRAQIQVNKSVNLDSVHIKFFMSEECGADCLLEEREGERSKVEILKILPVTSTVSCDSEKWMLFSIKVHPINLFDTVQYHSFENGLFYTRNYHKALGQSKSRKDPKQRMNYKTVEPLKKQACQCFTCLTVIRNRLVHLRI